MNFKCEECGKESISEKALKIHLTKKHKIDAKSYYLKWISHEIPKCVDCENEAKFLNLTVGFNLRCSRCNQRYLQKEFYSNLSPEKKKEISDKNKATKMKKYNNPNYNNIEKNRKTKLQRYGDENYNNRKKAKITYPTHTEEALKKQKRSHFVNWLTSYKEKIFEKFNATVIDTIGNSVIMKCNSCENEFSFSKSGLNNYYRWNLAHICPVCFPSHKTSKAEREIFDYVLSLGEKAVPNDHTALGKKELDIYIPSKNIGIEYDGLFWHSKERDGNLKLKSDLCLEKRIRCVHIFEDEWISKKSLVKSRLSSILGHNEKIAARKTTFSELNISIAEKFLNENCLDGYKDAEIAVGLFKEKELVSVMTFKKCENDEFELFQFSSKLYLTVIGGFSKLLKNFLKIHKEAKHIVSFSDNRWTNENTFIKSGFQKSSVVAPKSYYFVDNTKRYETKFHLRDFHEILDCGESKYVYEVTTA